MLGHKTSFSKFKKTEIISSIFSDHNGMKQEINEEKLTNILTFHNTISWFACANLINPLVIKNGVYASKNRKHSLPVFLDFLETKGS